MALSSISITAPSSAREGDRVSVSARVTNISADSYSFRVKLYAVQDIYAVPAPGDLLDTFEEIIGSGAYKTISGSFTMPAWDTIVLVMVYRFIDYWDFDNYTTKVVSLGEIAEVVPCEITITAPNSAAEGEKVSVSVLLKNVSSYGYMYKTEIYAVPDLFPDFRIGTIEKYINSGATFTAYGSFTMPASNTTVFIWVERWAVDHWTYDSSASRVVSLKIPVPEYKGAISKKELDYDGARNIIPVY